MTDDKIPVLLDTDIGSDIDDAVCLAYLLKQPRCELVGITTVTGEPQKRAQLASAVCRAAGRDHVPIHSGAEHPMLVPLKQARAAQAAVLPRWPHQERFEPNTAVQFMRETIRSRPGEIVLLTIGPLTNAGLLFALDPETARLLRGYVLMCGHFVMRTLGNSAVEWNAIGDPHATAICYAADASPHTSVGIDITRRCTLPADECRERLRRGPLDVVADMAEVWFKRVDRITFHDPLAAAIVFEPDICQYDQGRVEVELLSRQVMGMTHWTPDANAGKHRVASDVNVDRFFEHYFDVVSS